MIIQTKPHIFIAMHYMEIGGAESSLIGLLEALDPEKVDVDLFIYSHQGLYMSAIPSHVNLLPEIGAYSMIEKPMTEVLRRGYIRVLLARLIAKQKCKNYKKTHFAEGDDSTIFGYLGKEMSKVVPDLYQYGEYDLAISYLTPHNFVLDHVNAKKKICWIHTDYSKVSLNTDLELPVWGGYDKIISISHDVTEGFLSKFPSLKDKILEMENILPTTYIEERANATVPIEGYNQNGVLTLCSVGRIGYAKNYDNIPYMAKELKELMNEDKKTQTSFKWYIVGPGDHSKIDKLSEELGVKDNVIFLGPSDNPYPYIKNCDIYVHPSRYEGKSIVVREAQILCKPVVITNYPTSSSQIRTGIDGMIVPMDNEGCAKGLADIICDKALQKKIVDYLKIHDYGNESEVEKIYSLIK